MTVFPPSYGDAKEEESDVEAICERLLSEAREADDREFLLDPATRLQRLIESVREISSKDPAVGRRLKEGILDSRSVRSDMRHAWDQRVNLSKQLPEFLIEEQRWVFEEKARFDIVRTTILDFAFPPEDVNGRPSFHDPTLYIDQIEDGIRVLQEHSPDSGWFVAWLRAHHLPVTTETSELVNGDAGFLARLAFAADNYPSIRGNLYKLKMKAAAIRARQDRATSSDLSPGS